MAGVALIAFIIIISLCCLLDGNRGTAEPKKDASKEKHARKTKREYRDDMIDLGETDDLDILDTVPYEDDEAYYYDYDDFDD